MNDVIERINTNVTPHINSNLVGSIEFRNGIEVKDDKLLEFKRFSIGAILMIEISSKKPTIMLARHSLIMLIFPLLETQPIKVIMALDSFSRSRLLIEEKFPLFNIIYYCRSKLLLLESNIDCRTIFIDFL